MLEKMQENLDRELPRLNLKGQALRLVFIIFIALALLCLTFAIVSFFEAGGGRDPSESVKLGIAFLALMPLFGITARYFYGKW